MSISIDRLVTPLLTPFKENLEIDYESIINHVEILLKNNIKNIFILSTSGEWYTLNYEERIKIIDKIVDIVGDKTNILVGIHSHNVYETFKILKYLNDIDIKYVVSLPPAHTENFTNIINYYNEICRMFNGYLMLYTYPKLMGYRIPVEILVSIVRENPNIDSIKITDRDLSYIYEVIIEVKKIGRDVKIFTGNGYYVLPIIEVGGYGTVDILLNVFPRIYRNIIGYYHVGDIEKLCREYKKLIELYMEIKKLGNIVKVCKSILKQLKIYNTDKTRIVVEDVKNEKILKILDKYREYVISM